MTTDQKLPLRGLRVIDCATLFAGPFIATTMGDFGAEVIKVEQPGKGDDLRRLGFSKDGYGLWWAYGARNKRSVSLNLRVPEGQELLRQLAKTADVLVENFRPGTMERWNLGWETLHELNPRLVMVRVTGFGQTGPYSHRAGFGTLAEAMSGFAHMNGEADGPPILPAFAMADAIAGLHGCYGVMYALWERNVNGGTGQYLDVSLLEPIFSFLGPQISTYDQTGFIQGRTGNRLPFSVPRNAYKTKDDKWVALSASAQSIFERVCVGIGRPELIADERFKNMQARIENADEIEEIVGNWMRQHTRDEVLTRFEEVEAALAPVYDVSEFAADPHVQARGTIVRVPDPQLGTIAMQNALPYLSTTPGQVRTTGPHTVGEHTDQVLSEWLGYGAAQIERLRQSGVV
ncbi:MAG: CoA transferase [Chloroflexi bacterium]|nr:CoA transferase [Chloroflexota bacterium]